MAAINSNVYDRFFMIRENPYPDIKTVHCERDPHLIVVYYITLQHALIFYPSVHSYDRPNNEREKIKYEMCEIF